jgi:hypothetical protein
MTFEHQAVRMYGKSLQTPWIWKQETASLGFVLFHRSLHHARKDEATVSNSAETAGDLLHPLLA